MVNWFSGCCANLGQALGLSFWLLYLSNL